MTNDQMKKLLKTRVAAERALRGQGLPNKAIDLLAEKLMDAPSVKAHVQGTAPAPTTDEMLAEVWATQTGQDLRAVLDAHEEDTRSDEARQREAELAEIAKLPPAARMAAARKLGIKD